VGFFPGFVIGSTRGGHVIEAFILLTLQCLVDDAACSLTVAAQ
jgi:hypothetical protein